MLQHVIEKRKTKSGEMIDVVTLPIKNNNLFLSEKGNCYLDLIGFEVAPEKRKTDDTHLVKQSLPKDVQEKMSEEEKRAMPILGNLRVWGNVEQEPVQSADLPPAPESTDQLPF